MELREIIYNRGNKICKKKIKAGQIRIDSLGREYKIWSKDEDEILFYCIYESIRTEKTILEGSKFASLQLKDIGFDRSIESCNQRWARIKHKYIDQLVEWSIDFYRQNNRLPRYLIKLGYVADEIFERGK